MLHTSIETERWQPIDAQLPEAGVQVLCRNSTLQAIGYLDCSGRWHFLDGAPFPGVCFWQSLTISAEFAIACQRHSASTVYYLRHSPAPWS